MAVKLNFLSVISFSFEQKENHNVEAKRIHANRTIGCDRGYGSVDGDTDANPQESPRAGPAGCLPVKYSE